MCNMAFFRNLNAEQFLKLDIWLKRQILSHSRPGLSTKVTSSCRAGLHGPGCTSILLWEKERKKNCSPLHLGRGSSSLGKPAAFLLALEAAHTEACKSHYPGTPLGLRSI